MVDGASRPQEQGQGSFGGPVDQAVLDLVVHPVGDFYLACHIEMLFLNEGKHVVVDG